MRKIRKSSCEKIVKDIKRAMLTCLLRLDLSWFDDALLIAFTATKETDYGTETDE